MRKLSQNQDGQGFWQSKRQLTEEEEIELMQILIGDAENLDSAESQQGTAKRTLEKEGDDNESNKKHKTN